MVQMEDIQRFADQIARQFQPERILLFGSFASGEAAADSDVDLLVIMRCEGKPWRHAARIRDEIRRTFPLDIIVRTPEDFRRRIAQGDPFLRKIAEQGKVLYEVDHA